MVALVVVNEAIFPFPVAANPIAALEFVQAKEVPETPKLLENKTGLEGEPTQYAAGAWASTVGVGFTVIVKDSLVPVQVVGPCV